MFRFFFLTAVLVFVSCGTTVNYDYEKETNFSKYRAYTFYHNLDSGLNELDDKRIKRAIDSMMPLQGFTKSDYASFYINFHTTEGVARSRNTLGVGIGSGGGNVVVGISGGIPIGGNVIEQIVTFDFIDALTDTLIWQAVGKCELKEKSSPEQKDQHYRKLIAKMLKGFPPKK